MDYNHTKNTGMISSIVEHLRLHYVIPTEPWYYRYLLTRSKCVTTLSQSAEISRAPIKLKIGLCMSKHPSTIMRRIQEPKSEFWACFLGKPDPKWIHRQRWVRGDPTRCDEFVTVYWYFCWLNRYTNWSVSIYRPSYNHAKNTGSQVGLLSAGNRYTSWLQQFITRKRSQKQQ